jgi:hypothetical protein
MSDRKVFTDSVTELPAEPGLTKSGLMVTQATTETRAQPPYDSWRIGPRHHRSEAVPSCSQIQGAHLSGTIAPLWIETACGCRERLIRALSRFRDTQGIQSGRVRGTGKGQTIAILKAPAPAVVAQQSAKKPATATT